MRYSEFERLVAEGVESIGESFLERLDNVAIVIKEEPTREQKRWLEIGKEHVLLGLYEGIPRTARGAGYSGVLPDKITLFRRPIMEMAETPEEVRRVVHDTVRHEIAHHFGMSEADVARFEKKRKER